MGRALRELGPPLGFLQPRPQVRWVPCRDLPPRVLSSSCRLTPKKLHFRLDLPCRRKNNCSRSPLLLLSLLLSKASRMPRIKSYTPRWLTDAADGGHGLFTRSHDDIKAPPFSSKKAEPGPRRTVARRGTEVFVANGKELKWGDLVYLRDGWAAKQARSNRRSQIKREESNGSLDAPEEIANGDGYSAEGYRVRGWLNVCWTPGANLNPRPSKRPSQTTSDSLSCRRWRTTWQFSRPTRCTSACFRIPRT